MISESTYEYFSAKIKFLGGILISDHFRKEFLKTFVNILFYYQGRCSVVFWVLFMKLIEMIKCGKARQH